MEKDMLVRLYDLDKDEIRKLELDLMEKEIYIKKVLPSDMTLTCNFVKENFRQSWADETMKAVLFNKCYVAVKNQEILGFCCYDVSQLDILGPIGVKESCRENGIGKVLLLKSLLSMKELGYTYAIIGWAGPQDFYAKCSGAVAIEDSIPGSYENKLRVVYNKK